MKAFDKVDAEAQLIHARRTAVLGKPHAHEQAMIFVPLAGALRFAIGDVSFVADTTHALVVRANIEHRHEPGDEVEYFIAYVDDRRLAARLATAAPAFRFPNTTLVRELAGELLAMAADGDREAVAAATTLLCVQAARGESRPNLADAPLPDDARLARAIELARERYRAGVSSKELAAVAGMSPRAFERTLLRACGTTPRRLVEELRLAEAQARLATGRESVTTVAYDLGYKSLSHFVRRFRAAFGTTPGATRKGDRPPQTGKPGPARGRRLPA